MPLYRNIDHAKMDIYIIHNTKQNTECMRLYCGWIQLNAEVQIETAEAQAKILENLVT